MTSISLTTSSKDFSSPGLGPSGFLASSGLTAAGAPGLVCGALEGASCSCGPAAAFPQITAAPQSRARKSAHSLLILLLLGWKTPHIALSDARCPTMVSPGNCFRGAGRCARENTSQFPVASPGDRKSV